MKWYHYVACLFAGLFQRAGLAGKLGFVLCGRGGACPERSIQTSHVLAEPAQRGRPRRQARVAEEPDPPPPALTAATGAAAV